MKQLVENRKYNIVEVPSSYEQDILVEGTLDEDQLYTIYRQTAKRIHDSNQTIEQVLQRNSLPIGTAIPEKFLSGEDKTKYLDAFGDWCKQTDFLPLVEQAMVKKGFKFE